MALCTICLADPCPHLLMRGGTAGAPLVAVGVAAKYAPSTRPHCPSCDRIHRNIGTDNQPVCAWRTFSRAKGADILPMLPEHVDEFAHWFRSGAWTAPVKRKSGGSPGVTPGPVPGSVSPASSAGVTPGSVPPATSTPSPAPAGPTILSIADPEPLPEETPVERWSASTDTPTGAAGVMRPYTREEEDAAIKRAEDLAADRTLLEIKEEEPAPARPRKAPAFSKGKTIKNETKKIAS